MWIGCFVAIIFRKMDKMLRNPGFQHIAEDIFMNWDLKDLVNCLLVSKLFNQILENPFFDSKDGSGEDHQRKPRKIASLPLSWQTTQIWSRMSFWTSKIYFKNANLLTCLALLEKELSMWVLVLNQNSVEKFYHQALKRCRKSSDLCSINEISKCFLSKWINDSSISFKSKCTLSTWTNGKDWKIYQ